ncbi:MAG: hypothetical protein ACRDFX_08370 [Chloroflexota bacterium]
MRARDFDESVLEEGLHTIEAEFFSTEYVMRGEIISPEARLSDHLNSSTETLELRPLRVQRTSNGQQINISGTNAYITKSHVLFVLPLREPRSPQNAENDPRTATMSHTCWIGLGRYSLLGKVHMDAGRNPRLFLRSFEQRQFLPVTDARLTLPDGTVRAFPAIVVNRMSIEVLALEGTDQ